MLLRNVTVANSTGVGVQSFAGSGTSDISIGNSLIAGNTIFTLASDGAGTMTFTSLGNNLLDSINTVFSGPNDQIDPAPMIGTLTSNGGPTPTHALLTGSTAVNMGNNALALDADDDLLLTDQRGPGFDRIVGVRADIGAFELQTFNPTPGDYNADSVVNAADYTIWRDALNATGLTPFCHQSKAEHALQRRHAAFRTYECHHATVQLDIRGSETASSHLRLDRFRKTVTRLGYH